MVFMSDYVIGNFLYGVFKGVFDWFVIFVVCEFGLCGIFVNVLNFGLIDIGWMDDEICIFFGEMMLLGRFGCFGDIVVVVEFFVFEEG